MSRVFLMHPVGLTHVCRSGAHGCLSLHVCGGDGGGGGVDGEAVAGFDGFDWQLEAPSISVSWEIPWLPS
eukprot:COSAG05_NODE_2156_length_3459_cov_6.286310_1_plen_70_part_00